MTSTHDEVLVYEAPDGAVRVDVRLEGETVWLSLPQMAELFGRDKSVISRHLRNVFASGELSRAATVAKNATVQREGEREVVREIEFYNLDAILSVGYRVNSRRGTQFRIWATRTLRDHLLRGYTVHKTRLAETGIADLEQAVALLARTLTRHALVTDEGEAVLDVVQQYSRTWRLLLAYDENRLAGQPSAPLLPVADIDLTEARQMISRMQSSLAGQGEASELFGRERGDQFAALLGAIRQTFGGEPLYASVQARAAHLLYFVIKDHPFTDGNKRIGTVLFLNYLHRHGLLLRPDGELRFADNAVVALALLVAESDAAQKELMIRLILNLLEDSNPERGAAAR
jgi:prophage maintenance system killer protein